jgi:hypothetical protein
MEHFRHEANCWRFIGIFFGELYRQLKGTVLEGRIVRAENHSIPYHYVVISRRSRDTGRWVFLESTRNKRKQVCDLMEFNACVVITTSRLFSLYFRAHGIPLQQNEKDCLRCPRDFSAMHIDSTSFYFLFRGQRI